MPVNADWFLLEPWKFKSAGVASQKRDFQKQGPVLSSPGLRTHSLGAAVPTSLVSSPQHEIQAWESCLRSLILCECTRCSWNKKRRQCEHSSSLVLKTLTLVRLDESSYLLSAPVNSLFSCASSWALFSKCWFYIILSLVPCSLQCKSRISTQPKIQWKLRISQTNNRIPVSCLLGVFSQHYPFNKNRWALPPHHQAGSSKEKGVITVFCERPCPVGVP